MQVVPRFLRFLQRLTSIEGDRPTVPALGYTAYQYPGFGRILHGRSLNLGVRRRWRVIAMSEQKRYWFPTRTYGWGWGLPTTWQGWVVYAAFVALVLLAAILFPPSANPEIFTVAVMVFAAFLVVVCWIKGEPPRWRWGGK